MAGNLGLRLSVILLLFSFFSFCNIEIEIDSISAEQIEMDHAKEIVPDSLLGKDFSIYYQSDTSKTVVLTGTLNKNKEKKGVWKIFDIQGDLKIHCEFKKNETIKFYYLYESGQLRLKKEKRLINKHKIISFYSDGTIRESKIIKKNQLVGKFKKYKPSGQLDYEGKYSRPTSKINPKEQMDGVKNGKWRYYSNNGTLIKVIIYKKGSIVSSVEY